MDKIDFVITWVDGSDPNWLIEKNKYSDVKVATDDEINRYRDMGTLKYLFRGIEEYAPWVNKVHFVTWGHLPEWLNTKCEKLNIVNHNDFIPEKYLPTFSSHPIEFNIHRIDELSEKFVLFNDDMFLLNPLEETFFFKNNLPCDHWKENPLKTEKENNNFFDHIVLNDLFVINKNFDKKKVMSENKNKVFNLKYGKRNLRYLMLKRWDYFTGFDLPHIPNAYLKSSFNNLWEREYELLDNTCSHKFRNILDINHWVINFWQICEGKFCVKSHKNDGRYYMLSDDNKELIQYMMDKKSTVVCINDSNNKVNFDLATDEIIKTFEQKLPRKSSFEK